MKELTQSRPMFQLYGNWLINLQYIASRDIVVKWIN